MKRMQHCFYCGENLGVFEVEYDELPTCGKQECEREARYEYQARDADARERAEEDGYDRYR
jgi:hypothetical protein